MRKNQTIRAVALTGRVANQEVQPLKKDDEPRKVIGKSHPDYPEIEVWEDTFEISVKDDEKKIVYENEAEPFQYYKAPSLETHLKYAGAKLTDDQVQFLSEALKGSKETGEAVLSLVETLNAALKAKAKQAAYSSKFNEKKPFSEESKSNSKARMVRDFMRNSNVSDDTAIGMLKVALPAIFGDYTIEEFRKNQGRV